MISNAELTMLLNVAQTLRQHGELTMADEVNEMLTIHAAMRAKVGRPRGAPATGRPARAFTVAAEPGWQATCHGARAAEVMVNESLTEFGLPASATAASIQQAISRNGQWLRLCQTANGTVALTVQRADP